MGGGSSKVADKYIMVTDRKLTNEYYQRVERSSMPQEQMKSSRSMNVSSAPLKKEQSENSISMTSCRKSDAPMLVRNKTEINLKSSISCDKGVVISARLPWLVKEASIPSGWLQEIGLYFCSLKATIHSAIR